MAEREQCVATDGGVRCAFVAGHGGNHSWMWCMAQGASVRFEQPLGESSCERRSKHPEHSRCTIPQRFHREEPMTDDSAMPWSEARPWIVELLDQCNNDPLLSLNAK